MVQIGEILGSATLDLNADLGPLDRDLATAERRVALSVATMQTLLDRSGVQMGQRFGAIGTEYDRHLTPPLARFGTATATMAQQVDGSLGQMRIETAATARELERTAAIAQAVAAVESAAAEKASRAYAGQAAAAKLSASEQETAALKIRAAQLAQAHYGSFYTSGRPSTQRVLERTVIEHETGGSPIMGVRGPGGGSIANPVVVVMEAGSRTGLGSMAAAVGQSAASGDARSTTVASGGTDGGGTAIVSSGGAGGGGGGTTVVPVPAGGGSGGGDGRGILSKLLWGGGSAIPFLGAAAGMGSIGSFAGLGPEHVLMTILGLAGSATGGLAGGGLLAAGAAGQLAVGGGSDFAVVKSTIADTQQLGQAYQKVQEAVGKYGAESKQAAMAQHELNMLMLELGNTAGVKAEVGLAKQGEALNTFWDKATSGARVQAVNILSQVLKLGTDYVPRVAQAAEMNLAIINKGLKPMFSWLEGPEGIGIFNDLERRFEQNLPTAMHGFSQDLELILKTIDTASQYTGGFTATLDRFFTKWNSPAFFAKWHDEIGRLVADFHLWQTFLKVLGEDIFGFFHADVETGRGIVETITQMLEKLREWERSTVGQERLHTVFQVHKEEVLALLGLLPPLLHIFSSIYLTISPPLVQAFTGIAESITWVLNGLLKLGPAMRDLLGVSLVLAKLGILVPTVQALGTALGVTGAAGAEAAAGATAAGAANASLVAPTIAATDALVAEDVAFAGGAGAGALGSAGLASKAATADRVLGQSPLPSQMFAGANAAQGLGSRLIRGAVYGGGAALVTNSVLNVAGVKGPGNTILSMAAAGAGLGLEFGGPWGAAAGGLAAAGIGAAITLFNHKATDYGKKFADGFVAPLAPMLTQRTAQQLETTLHKQANAVEQAKRPQSGKQSLEEVLDPFGLESHHGKADLNKVFLAELRQGLGAAEAMKSAFSGVVQKTVHQFVTDTAQGLRQLPPEAQKAAAEAMVKYAGSLESEGKLPKHAVGKVITGLEQQFPELVAYFREHSLVASAQVAAAMKMHQAETNLASSLNNLRAEWGLFNLDPVVNGKNWVHNTSLAMQDLRAIIATSTGTAKQDAINHLEELERKNHEVFGNMAASTKTNMAKWGQFVRGGLEGAAPAAQQELGKFVARVEEAEHQGAISAQFGAKLIAEATNAELKALGAKEIPIPSLVQGKPKSGTVGAQGAAFGPGFAGGGLMQIGNHGEAGYDTVPMNIGGQNVVVAPGEQVAVFNRHQLPIVNAALGPIGGLEGLFSHVDTPHYMAQGGLVGKMVAEANKINSLHYPYVWGGGHGNFDGPYDCSGAVSAVLHAAGLIAQPEVSGELASFGAPGPGEVTIYANPIHTFMSIMGRFFGTHGSEGAGWYAGSSLPGYAVRHVPVNAGEGLGAIRTPQVKGPGAIAALARAGLGKAAAAANRYLETHAFGASALGRSEANMGHMVPGIMSIEQRAAGIAGLAWNPGIVAALLSHESSGGINEPPTGPLSATGPNQVIPSTFASYALAGHKQISNPLDNAIASMRYIKARYGSLSKMASTTGLLDGHYVGYARGGLFSGGGHVAHTATSKTPKTGKPKGARHVKKPAKPKAMSLKHLTSTLGAIPGMTHIGAELGPQEGTYNLLGDEETLLGSMTSNPASILAADMPYLTPTLVAGESIGPGMLVPHAERELQRALQAHGESPGLTLQGSLLQWIGGLDDHRLLSGPDIGVLKKDFAGTAGHTKIQGVPFNAGYPVFRAQQSVLEAQKRAQEALVHIQRLEKTRAVHFIQQRQLRRKCLEALLKAVYQRYRSIQRRLALSRTAGLHRRLNQAEARHAQQEAHQREIRDAQAHRAALRDAISSEKELNPWEQNHALLSAWQAEERHLGTVISSSPPSTAAISSAQEALERNTLQNELKPLGEQLHLLGGSSTSIGSGGEFGVETKQISGLKVGATELDSKIRESVQSTIPQLELSIAGIRESLAEEAESVAPAIIPSAVGEKPGESELSSLLKTQNEQLSQQLAVSQAQYKVLSQLPPFAGKFHDGGVVPGPIGAEMMALVQGGEVISQPGSGSYEAHVHVADGMGWLKDLIRVEVKQGTRTMARAAGRPLPSRGGGLFS